MKPQSFFGCLMLGISLFSQVPSAFAATMDDTFGAQIAVDPTATRVWAFAATITLDWAAFPHTQHISYANPFDFTGIVWLTGHAKSDVLNGLWQQYVTPRRMNYEPWITEEPNRIFFIVGTRLGPECCWYSGCSALNPDTPVQNPNQICNVSGCCVLGNCPGRPLLESGTGMDIDGRLRIVDRHGGSQSDLWILLSNLFSYQGQNTQVFVSIHIVRPGPYGRGYYYPGQQVPFKILIQNSIKNLTIEPKALAVHHSSSDISGASKGYVDSSDLAAFSQNLGKIPSYVYGGGCGAAAEPGCWYADLNGSGTIDATDLAIFSSELNGPECPDFSKVTAPGESKETILAWFGMAYSGRMINVGWTDLPEVVVVDYEQMQRAIQDPYGYRNLTPTQAIRWSLVKSLYR